MTIVSRMHKHALIDYLYVLSIDNRCITDLLICWLLVAVQQRVGIWAVYGKRLTLPTQTKAIITSIHLYI
jgi:hypothetical protein